MKKSLIQALIIHPRYCMTAENLIEDPDMMDLA